MSKYYIDFNKVEDPCERCPCVISATFQQCSNCEQRKLYDSLRTLVRLGWLRKEKTE